ncbi:uncharacterized protein LOC115662957 [Syzygium oleosum]|uniref:uncharacterized protein LOC115662957 n=1 Tax=Syzygium oleosum TaxID=219896 RepID=UPI0024BA5CB0|nr:uncharacterized protein LOC115662957 [Syzygium oleosum]
MRNFASLCFSLDFVCDLVALPSSGVALRVRNLASSSSFYHRAMEVDMVRKRDRFWEYAEHLDGRFKCKFCDKIFAGGVPRVKSHLSGIKGGGIDICTKVPEDVRVAVAEAISGSAKRAKAEASSGKTEETSPKILISNESVMLDKLLAKFILLNDVDVNIVRRPSFIDFVNGLAEHGSHYKLPCCSVVKAELVPDLEKEIGEYVANVKKSWDKTGCTIMFDIWCDKERSFINIFAHSIEGMVLLNALNIHNNELTSVLLREIVYFVTQKIGADNIVQCITSSVQVEGLFKIMPNDNHSHVYETNCVAQEIHLLFEDIYNGIEWVRKTFDQARAVVIEINKHNGILSSMKQVTNNRELKQSSRTKFYSSYYMLQSIMGVESELQLLVSSSEWLSSSFEKHESGEEVGKLICSSEFWIEGKEVLHALKSIFQVLRLVDSYGATSGFLYAAVKMADEAIKKIYETNVQKYQRLWDIFQLRQSRIIHPIHAAAAFLNPAYMCSEKFIENNAMKQGIYFILEKLVAGEEKEKFLQDMLLYCKKVPELFTCSAMTMLRTSHPCDWWDYCGDALPVLKKFAIRILSQRCSTLSCRQSLSAFETAQVEKMEPLMPAVKDNYLYLRINALLMENFNTMKGKIRKPLDLEKLGELPDCTEFINENFSRDLLNATKVPLSDGKLNCWSASMRKDGESEKHLRLHFITKLPSSLVKGNEVEGERGAPIHVILVDSSTGSVVQSGPSSVLKLMVTVIGGDFDEEAGKDWTREYFGSNEIRGREGKIPLLTGDLSMILDRGMGTLGAITFNDISSWTRSGKFRLGVKTALSYCEGIRVHEGTSNAFAVEDANTGKSRIESLVEPSSMEVTKQLLSSRPHCQTGNASPVVSRSFGDAQEAACSRVNDAVSVAPGMRRCEKNCRLSCINDLKPDSNRPAFSLEEENLIFQLHALLGNRWSEIAARLPGRTDKEIKDFLDLFPQKEAEAKR